MPHCSTIIAYLYMFTYIFVCECPSDYAPNCNTIVFKCIPEYYNMYIVYKSFVVRLQSTYLSSPCYRDLVSSQKDTFYCQMCLYLFSRNEPIVKSR